MLNNLENYTVDIVYRNKSLEYVDQKKYLLTDFCQNQKLNLMHIISDVENAFYNLQDNQTKEDWPKETMEAFQKIRHKLLDAANNIERLPKNLRYKNQSIENSNSGECVADLINGFTKNSRQ